MFAYSLRNDKLASYDPPFFCNDDEQACDFFHAMLIPSWNSASKAVRSLIDDLTLYKVGQWSEKDALLVPDEPYEVICPAVDLFENDKA